MQARSFSSRPFVWVAAWAALPLTAGVALADARYTRKTTEVKVQQTEATKKLEAKKKEEPKGPDREITADLFFQIQGEVQDIRDAQIEEYKQLIQDTEDNDPEKADLLFRLAEQYAKKARYFHFKAMEVYAKIDKAKSDGEKAKLGRDQKKNFDLDKKWLVEAVKIYSAIAEKPQFRNYARMDEALFYYAYTLTQAGRDDDARKVYHRLIKDYPNSKYIPDSYLAFGEYYFKQQPPDLASAEKFYDKVLSFPKSSVYVYALYMKGWVQFNEGRPQDALDSWIKVAERTQNDKKQNALNRASKKDVVRAYADVGKPELAFKMFEKIDKDYAFKMLGFLGEYYLGQGKAEKTVFVFRQMMEFDLTRAQAAAKAEEKKPDKQICEWEHTVVRAILTVGTPEQKIAEIGKFNKLYKYLKDNQAIPEANLAECRDNAMETNGQLAKIWHQEGVKTLNYDILANAQKLYATYMEYFSDANDAPEMQFYLAELMWKRAEGEKVPALAAQRWEDAAVVHTKVVEMAKVEPERLKTSAYASVLAWQNALNVDPSADRPEVDTDKDVGQVPKPDPIPEKELKMVAAFDVYIKYVNDPKDDELTQMKFLKARTFWRYKHYEEAIPILEEIVRIRPDHQYAEVFVNVLLDSLNRAGRTRDLIDWVDRLLVMERFLNDKPDVRAQLELIKRQSMRKLAEKLEKEGKFRECGNAYLDIFNRYPNGDDLDEVLHNAGVCFEKGKLIGQAILMRKNLIEKFPTKPTAQKAQYALGVNYAAIAYYDQAAAYYEEYAKKFSGEKDAQAALSSATFIRKGLGQDDKAIDLTKYFIDKYGGKVPKEAASAFFSIADVYEKRKDFDTEVRHLTDYLGKWGAKGGVDRQVIAHVKMGEILWKQSCPVAGVNGACIEVKRERALKESSDKGGKKKKRSVTQTQCGAASKNKIIVHERKPALVKMAKSHFDAAIKLWKGGDATKDVGGKDDAEKAMRTAQMIYWVGAANYYLGDEKLEQFLGMKFPENLNFDPTKPKKAKESMDRFQKWNDDKQKALATTQAIYMKVVNEIKGGGAHWAIASAARVGQLLQNFSDALFTAEIPKDVREGEFADDAIAAYCDQLTDIADPLEQKSIDAFSFCLQKSTDLNWFNEWSRLCEGELAQIRPQDYPTAGEIRSDPVEVPMTLDTQPVITELDAGGTAQR